MEDIRLLVVDDNIELCKKLKKFLEIKLKYKVDIATSGDELFALLKSNNYDSMTLDIEMGDDNGLELIEKIKSYYGGPILFLTGVDDLESKLNAFKSGADDYVVKPFEMAELIVRIERSVSRAGQYRMLTFGDYKIDVNQQKAYMDNKLLNLHPVAVNLLTLLLKRSNEILTREEIFEYLWEGRFEYSSRVVDVQISKIRKATNDDKIKSIRGVGYKYED